MAVNVVAVTTTRRDGASYLARTLTGVGPTARRRLVVSDGPLAYGYKLPEGWESAVSERAEGSRKNGWHALLLAHWVGAESLLLLQDDLEVHPDGGWECMDRAVVPAKYFGLAFYAPFAPAGYVYNRKDRRARVEPVPPWSFMGAQALLLPRRSVAFLVERDPFAAPGVDPKNPHLFDDAVHAYARAAPQKFFGLVLPHPVRHVGKVSACRGGVPPHVPAWVAEFDRPFPEVPGLAPTTKAEETT